MNYRKAILTEDKIIIQYSDNEGRVTDEYIVNFSTVPIVKINYKKKTILLQFPSPQSNTFIEYLFSVDNIIDKRVSKN